MVKIIDITEEKERKIKQEKLEEQLAKECFVGKKVELNYIHCIYISDKLKRLASKLSLISEMDVYDESVLPQAQIFAKRYEKQFNQNDFTITTDYSKGV